MNYFDPLGRITHRSLLNIFLSKTFFEIMAIGTARALYSTKLKQHLNSIFIAETVSRRQEVEEN